MSKGKEYKQVLEQMSLVTHLGLSMSGSIILGFAIGYWLDKWLHTRGIFLVIFIILGIMGGGWLVYKNIMALDEGSDDDKFY